MCESRYESNWSIWKNQLTRTCQHALETTHNLDSLRLKKAGSQVKYFNPKTIRISEVTRTFTSSGTFEEDAFKESGEDGEDEGDEEYAAKKEGDGPDQLVDNIVKTSGIEDEDV